MNTADLGAAASLDASIPMQPASGSISAIIQRRQRAHSVQSGCASSPGHASPASRSAGGRSPARRRGCAPAHWPPFAWLPTAAATKDRCTVGRSTSLAGGVAKEPHGNTPGQARGHGRRRDGWPSPPALSASGARVNTSACGPCGEWSDRPGGPPRGSRGPSKRERSLPDLAVSRLLRSTSPRG